jgi:HEAT repeat protein
MQRCMPIAALAALGFVACVNSASANAAGNDLESRVTASDGWVAYHVPMVDGVDEPCCYSVREGDATRKGCDLDRRSWSFSTDDDDPMAALNGTVAIYFRVEHGRVERVRAVGASCPVRTEGTVRWIDPVDPAHSVAMLSSLLDRNAAGAEDGGLLALAYHADASATRALTARAEPSHPLKERGQALFWLGRTRGAEGADVVEHYATTDADPKLREKAIFALSQSKAADVYEHILMIARTDPDEHVRGQAFFWLAHMDDARAKDDITASLKTESSDRVREQAVFALSQLRNGAADEALIAVLRGDYPRAVKKPALFWLGQSGSPRAMAYFDEVLK